MILKTTLSEIDEFIDKYSELLSYSWDNNVQVQEDINCMVGICGYRIQIPELGVSIREGDLCSKHGGEYSEYRDPKTGERIVKETPPPEDAEWEVDASVTVVCELNETDPKKYLGWSTDGIEGTLYEYCQPRFSSFSDLDKIECFVDTSEFIEDEEFAQKCAGMCEAYYDQES